MNRSILLGLSLLSVGAVLSPARANVGAPRPPVQPAPVLPPGLQGQKTEVNLVVQVDEKADLPRLQVPLNLLIGRAVPPATAPRRGAGAGGLGLPTVVAGLSLTLALVTGGLWLVRRRSGRWLVPVLVLSLCAAGSSLLWANEAPPPPRPRVPGPLPALKLPAGIELKDRLVLETVAGGDHLTLIVPKKMVLEKGAGE